MVFDLHSFNRLYIDFQQRFVHFAYTYVRDEMVAEDIVAESIMYYWENRNRLGEGINVPAYIMTAVKHKCIDYLRQQQNRQNVSDEMEKLSDWDLSVRLDSLSSLDPHEVFSNEIMEIANEALDSLSERTRQIFVKSRYENKSHKEIADEFGMTVKGVEFHLAKATSALRVALKDYLPASVLLLYVS